MLKIEGRGTFVCARYQDKSRLVLNDHLRIQDFVTQTVHNAVQEIIFI